MSFKGFTKGVARAPTVFKSKMNMGTQAEEDPVFVDAERRFKQFETETKRLSTESDKYFKAVTGLLDHQIEFSKGIEEIYKPISGKISDPNSTVKEDNPEGLEACQAYRELVTEMKSILDPDMKLIQERIIKPAKELLKIIDAIKKMLTKRHHKKIDLDRHTDSVSKIENKKGEKTEKDEERLYKAQVNVEAARQEFDYYNEICKKELPQLFYLQAEFIKPLFVSLYFMQLNVFYTLYSRMEEMKIPYFDLNSELLAAFADKRGNIEELTESLNITHFKLTYGKRKLELTRKRFGSPGADNEEPGDTSFLSSNSTLANTSGSTYPPSSLGSTSFANNYQAPPAYTPTAEVGGAFGAPQAVSQPATMAPHGVTYCTALYDYTAQAEGDLSFKAGDIIQIVERTPDQNGWWTGIVNNAQGVFPGNYVQVNQ